MAQYETMTEWAEALPTMPWEQQVKELSKGKLGGRNKLQWLLRNGFPEEWMDLPWLEMMAKANELRTRCPVYPSPWLNVPIRLSS